MLHVGYVPRRNYVASFCWPTFRARCALFVDIGLSVHHLSCDHISKTEQDRPIDTVERYLEVGTADSVAALRFSPWCLLVKAWLQASFLSQQQYSCFDRI